MLNIDVLHFAIVLALALVIGWAFVIAQTGRTTRKQVHRIAEQHTLIRADERARELCLAVHQLHPLVHAGIDFTISRDSPDQAPYLAEWNSSAPKPTPQELETALEKIKNKDLAAMRAAEYPSIGDQLDAAYKARHGDNAEQLLLDDKIKMIKEKYQKPGESSY